MKETICREPVSTQQLIDERLKSMHFELTGGSAAVNLVVVHAPTEDNLNAQMEEEFWNKNWGTWLSRFQRRDACSWW